MRVLEKSARDRSRLRFARLSDHIRAILDTIREPFVVLDGALRIRLVNKAFCRTFHITSNGVTGKSLRSLGSGVWKTPALHEWLKKVLVQGADISDFEMDGVFPNIGRRTMVMNARHVQISGVSRQIVLLTIEDATRRKLAERAMRKLNTSLKNDSITDELTGLYNRRGYTALSQHYLDLAHRRGKRVFVIYADLDGLKQINDQCGHKGGDQAIIRTADILRKTFRKSDIIARVGGDEFAIATIENGHDSASTQVARLQANLKSHASQNEYAEPISLSIGIARSDLSRSSSIEELTIQADSRMYIEKRRAKESKETKT